uniref:histone deacetylase n=1 Tax=Ditylum brightwellii TaxID=49249 RepID=A0A7S4RYI0_9STRA
MSMGDDVYFNEHTFESAKLAAGGVLCCVDAVLAGTAGIKIDDVDNLKNGNKRQLISNTVMVSKKNGNGAKTNQQEEDLLRQDEGSNISCEASFCSDDGEVINRAIALVRPPGHHACACQSMGFCYFNSIAMAAKYALKHHSSLVQRVLILDWDIHHGNGTQDATYDDERIMYVSLHRIASNGSGGSQGYFFPGTGRCNEVGPMNTSAEGTNLNIEWTQSHMGNVEYAAAFSELILPILSAYDPQLVLISCGLDAAKGDIIGDCDVTPEMYYKMTKSVMETVGDSVPIVVALEGGYELNVMGECMVGVARALSDEPWEESEKKDEAVIVGSEESNDIVKDVVLVKGVCEGGVNKVANKGNIEKNVDKIGTSAVVIPSRKPTSLLGEEIRKFQQSTIINANDSSSSKDATPSIVTQNHSAMASIASTTTSSSLLVDDYEVEGALILSSKSGLDGNGNKDKVNEISPASFRCDSDDSTKSSGVCEPGGDVDDPARGCITGEVTIQSISTVPSCIGTDVENSLDYRNDGEAITCDVDIPKEKLSEGETEQEKDDIMVKPFADLPVTLSSAISIPDSPLPLPSSQQEMQHREPEYQPEPKERLSKEERLQRGRNALKSLWDYGAANQKAKGVGAKRSAIQNINRSINSIQNAKRWREEEEMGRSLDVALTIPYQNKVIKPPMATRSRRQRSVETTHVGSFGCQSPAKTKRKVMLSMKAKQMMNSREDKFGSRKHNAFIENDDNGHGNSDGNTGDIMREVNLSLGGISL